MIRSGFRQAFNSFNKAVVRKIDNSIVELGLTLHKRDDTRVNLDRAIQQHENMKNILSKVGLTVHELPSDGYADSVFIEDTAVVIDDGVLLANPGAKTRRGEVKSVREFFNSNKVHGLQKHVMGNGKLDGGDVLFTGSEIFVGLSSRTNSEGIRDLSRAFPWYEVTIISLDEFQEDIPKQEQVLHLKSFCSMCGENKILVGGSVGRRFQSFFAEREYWEMDSIPPRRNESFDWEHMDRERKKKVPDLFPQYEVILLPDAAAANCIYVNNTIIRRASEEFPESGKVFETHDSLRNANQIELVYDELAKVDGAISCCSVLMKA